MKRRAFAWLTPRMRAWLGLIAVVTPIGVTGMTAWSRVAQESISTEDPSASAMAHDVAAKQARSGSGASSSQGSAAGAARAGTDRTSQRRRDPQDVQPLEMGHETRDGELRDGDAREDEASSSSWIQALQRIPRALSALGHLFLGGRGEHAQAGAAQGTPATGQGASAPDEPSDSTEREHSPASADDPEDDEDGESDTKRDPTKETECERCREQNCRHSLEADLIAGCFEEINPEYGANPADPTFLRQCMGVIACAHASGCAYREDVQAAGCYCGSKSIDDCATGGPAPDAPCVSVWQAATRSTDNTEIQKRMSDTAYPAGWAYFLLDCERQYCKAACSELRI